MQFKSEANTRLELYRWAILTAESHGRERSCPNVRYCPDICLEGRRNIKKTLSQDDQDNRSPSRDLKLELLEYKGLLDARQRRFIITISLVNQCNMKPSLV
jgi:hypothetical protein